MSEADFKAWGWRVPFLLSIVLVLVSLWIRLSLKESPLFLSIKTQGKASLAPLRESFGNWKNLRIVLLVLFGATAGQGIVWYTGQFYAYSFLTTTLKVDYAKATIIVAAALLLAMPFFVVFGALSDRIGRLKIMMTGNLIAALTYLPIYHAMRDHAGDPKNPNMGILIALVFVQVLYVTMVYGPIAAFLIESFPARIRYTSFSLPYHLGNGWFGGTLPLIAGLLVVQTKNIFAGTAQGGDLGGGGGSAADVVPERLLFHAETRRRVSLVFSAPPRLRVKTVFLRTYSAAAIWYCSIFPSGMMNVVRRSVLFGNLIR
jgi:MFS family permease